MREVILVASLCLSITALAAGDPTMPPHWNAQTQTTPIPKNITLSGIFISHTQQSAVINEKSVNVGDYIQGYEVTKIEENAVTLKNNHGVFMIPLNTVVITPVTTPVSNEKIARDLQ